MSNKRKGQGLVEFALILPVILLLFCVIIESGRLFHAYTTVQHAAREGARYAVTGLEMTDAGMDRVESIKWTARHAAGSLMVNPDKYWDQAGGTPYYDDSGALTIRVWGPDGEDDAGGPGERVKVSVVHNMPIITPFLIPIASYVQVTGEVEMINEGFGSGTAGGGHQGVMPPTLAPLSTIGPSPIPPTAFVLSIEADQTTIHTGDTVEFTYSLTNNTDMDLTGVQISDYWDDPVCTFDIADGATVSCTTEQAIDATMTNDVSASSPPFSDNESITITVIEPELTLTARSWETTVFKNTVLTFTYTVENTGDSPVAGVHVVDSLGTDTSATAQDTVNGDTVTWEVAHMMSVPGTIVVNVTAIGTDELSAPVTDDDAVVVEVLDLDPINISEPLRAGQTVVTGTAHAGRTVFIYDPQDSRISGTALVNGAGQFSFTGLPPLIAGHTIVVSGYGAYDSARVQGELDPIVITTDPLCHGATTIAGTAQPGETVKLSMPGYSDNTKADVDTGQFQFALYGGATFQYGQTVTVSGYGADPATKTVTWCGAGGDAFIVISPQCAPAGSTTTVRVEGYNWAYQNSNDDVDITWDSGSAVYDVPATPPEPWVQEIAVSTSPAGGTYTIQAANKQDSASAEFVFPCPAPNLIVTDVQ
ncbi:MAG: TadE/TadG family type IV pilus assembly protein, partial [Anaerolineae bacterium]